LNRDLLRIDRLVLESLSYAVRHHSDGPTEADVTVQKWEIGEKRPSGPSLKLLNVIERKGVEALG
jgi:hypothetical protein